jgi:hypothetical protein
MNQNGGQQQQGQQYQGPPNNQQQYQQGPPQGQQGQYQGGQQQGGHNCAHGPMTFVPAGINRNTNEAYSQYWKCPLQRGAQGPSRSAVAGHLLRWSRPGVGARLPARRTSKRVTT